MSKVSVGQIIMEAQKMASRVKDLDTLGSSLLIEAEGNNRLIESLRLFQDDLDSLNRLSCNKSNAEMVNRIQYQNTNSSEILKENRELKICIEDYERTMEFIMQKYREHTSNKLFETKINFKELHNDKLWKIICDQREKIKEMATVMHHAAFVDEDIINRDVEFMAQLRLENKGLRELLKISNQFSACCPQHRNEISMKEKSVQADLDESADELSLSGISIEISNNSVLQIDVKSADDALPLNVSKTDMKEILDDHNNIDTNVSNTDVLKSAECSNTDNSGDNTLLDSNLSCIKGVTYDKTNNLT